MNQSKSPISTMLRTFCAIAIIATSSMAHALDITSTPGNLKSLVDQPESVTNLTVTGAIDASDIFFIADEMPALRTLNLAGVTIAGYDGALTHNYTHYPAATIPARAFTGAPITTVILPDAPTTLGDGAFAASALTTIILKPSIAATGIGTFADCRSLTAVITNGATLGDYTFMGCPAMTSANITGTTTLPEGAFQNCSSLGLVTGTIDLTSIGAKAFEGCSALKSITLGAPLTSIGQYAFAESGLEAINLNACTKLAALPAWAFAKCPNLTSATLPSALAVVEAGAFFDCTNLSTVKFAPATIEGYTFKGTNLAATADIIPDGVQSIGDYALKDASGISTITLPNSLQYIGNGAMEGMTNLEAISGDALDHTPELGNDVWAGIDQKAVTLTVQDNMLSEFAATPQWCDFHIEAATTLITPNESLNTLAARFVGTTLQIRSIGEEIGNVHIYDPYGTLIISTVINSTEGEIDTATTVGNIFIIAVDRPDGTRAVLKLLR